MSAKRPKIGQKQGYEAELICKVTSYPPAAVSWVRDGKELNNNERYEISYLGVTNDETISTLKLKRVSEHHYGNYICKAKNAFGDDETTLELFGEKFFLWKTFFLSFLAFCEFCLRFLLHAWIFFKLFPKTLLKICSVWGSFMYCVTL